nr:MAG TPA_asm: hypothetical protein [Caudoviricetes sp.]
MITIDSLLQIALRIYSATLKNENTSKRVGGLFRDIINYFDENKISSGGYNGTAQNLYDLIFSIEGGYNGIASTYIINPLTQGYYISLSGGTFPNFGNLYVPEGYSIIYYDSNWKYESIPLNPNNPVLDTDFFT